MTENNTNTSQLEILRGEYPLEGNWTEVVGTKGTRGQPLEFVRCEETDKWVLQELSDQP